MYITKGEMMMAKETIEYRGFEIREGKDKWGDETYVGYRDGEQMFDVEYSVEDVKSQVDNYLE